MRRVRNRGRYPISVALTNGEVVIIPPGVEVELPFPPLGGYVYPDLEYIPQEVHPEASPGEPREAPIETPSEAPGEVSPVETPPVETPPVETPPPSEEELPGEEPQDTAPRRKRR